MCYEEAIKINPEKADYFSNKANALSELKKFDDAIITYNQAIKLNPKNENTYVNKGSTLLS